MNWIKNGDFAQKTEDGRYFITKTMRGEEWLYSAFCKKPPARLGTFPTAAAARACCEGAGQ